MKHPFTKVPLTLFHLPKPLSIPNEPYALETLALEAGGAAPIGGAVPVTNDSPRGGFVNLPRARLG